jgi:hypothetical protein
MYFFLKTYVSANLKIYTSLTEIKASSSNNTIFWDSSGLIVSYCMNLWIFTIHYVAKKTYVKAVLVTGSCHIET